MRFLQFMRRLAWAVLRVITHVVAIVLLLVAPVIIRDTLLVPAGGHLNGPVDTPVGIVLPVVVATFFFFTRRRWNRGPPGQRRVRSVALAACVIAYGYGLTSCWYVTADGVTIAPGWFLPLRDYAWADARSRLLYCTRSHGVVTWVDVTYANGRSLHLMQLLDQGDAVVPELLDKTKQAQTQLGDTEDCRSPVQLLFTAAAR